MREGGKRSKIEVIIFDINGVLELGPRTSVIDGNQFTKQIHQKMAKHFNLSLKRWFALLSECHDDDMGKSIFKKHLKRLANKLKISMGELEKLFLFTYKKCFRQNKKLYNFAFKLKKQGYKIAILSNQWYISKKAKVPEKLSKRFDFVVISCDVGCRKPFPEIYNILLKKLKTDPETCLFIDDTPENLSPAKKLGMNTILFQNNKQLFKQLSKQGIK